MQATDPAPQASQDLSLAAWLRLAHTPGVGRITAWQLVSQFGSPQAIFNATPGELGAHVSRARSLALKSALPPDAAASMDAAMAWQQGAGHHLLTPDHICYPARLRQIDDAPLVLYCVGQPELLSADTMAIVGSRNATVHGVANARAFGQALSETGITIVSGLAAGIDTAAHEGGLRGVGATIAVLGTGVDRVYPARNRNLAHAIAEHGCIVSEYSLGTPPLSANFPRRNRLISGLSRGVLVVEAAARSGSLITARLALEQGREVYAIPGSIHAPLSKGCHHLIKQGARLVETAADILDDLPLAAPGAAALPGADLLLDAMGFDPVDCNTLAAIPGMSAAALATRLLSLELAGEVQRLPGGLFQRVLR